ncbi:MAG: ParB N-terminal domain-containing protein, partial [Deltaproteobacteria bacterium]|nr:ParB N-terminal domain-containing protein [Deltaproteobacteria bacterium]
MLTRDVDSLKAHELNRKIYGDTADEALVDSISRQGILTPLLVTEAGVVISGHRRLEAARKLGLRAVPVQVMPLVGALPIEEALIAANEQRPRTVEQRVREFIHLREIERCRAKLRQRAAGERGHEGGRGRRKEQTLREVSPAGFAAGRSRDLAARRLQLSYKSLEHGVAVVARIDRLAKAGHGREAERLRELLNTKSIRAAFVAARNESGTGAGPRSDRHGAADAGAADEAAAARASAARAVERLVVELRRARSALPEGGLAEAADAAVASIQEAARRHASAGRPEAPARVYQWSLAGALLRAASDQVRALASHELVAALGCSHGCRYCLPAREHTPSALQALGLEADDDCYAVVDPDAPDRVGQQAGRALGRARPSAAPRLPDLRRAPAVSARRDRHRAGDGGAARRRPCRRSPGDLARAAARWSPRPARCRPGPAPRRARAGSECRRRGLAPATGMARLLGAAHPELQCRGPAPRRRGQDPAAGAGPSVAWRGPRLWRALPRGRAATYLSGIAFAFVWLARARCTADFTPRAGPLDTPVAGCDSYGPVRHARRHVAARLRGGYEAHPQRNRRRVPGRVGPGGVVAHIRYGDARRRAVCPVRDRPGRHSGGRAAALGVLGPAAGRSAAGRRGWAGARGGRAGPGRG